MQALYRALGAVSVTTALLVAVAATAQTEESNAADMPEATSTADAMPSAETTESIDSASAEMPSTAVTPGNYTCSLNGLVRRVEIAYDDAALKVPCAVNYYKDSESPNEMSTLWSAQNMTGYCEEKASEFVEKLQSWGWSCTLN